MNRRNRGWNPRKIGITVVGLIITITLFISMFSGFAGGDDTPETGNPADFETTPNSSPIPQLPDPVSDVTVSSQVVHRTGLFQVPLLEGDWAIFQRPIGEGDQMVPRDSNVYDPNLNRADIVLNSGRLQSIVQVYMLVGVNYEDMASVSENLLTDSYFTSEWSPDYDRWEITDRTIGNTFLTIDFELELDGLIYFGRQISWQLSGNLVNLRLVVPSNNPDLMANLQSLYIERFVYYPHIQTTPLEGWRAYSDPDQTLMVKIPDSWEVISGGIGRPTTLGLPDDGTLQVTVEQFDDVTLESAEDAEAWLNDFRDGLNIFEGRPVEQAFADGYWYSYTYPTPDGDLVSAAIALLNNGRGGIDVGEVRLTGFEGNLLESDSTELQSVAQTVLDSFTVLATDDYVFIEQDTDEAGVESGETPTSEASE